MGDVEALARTFADDVVFESDGGGVVAALYVQRNPEKLAHLA